MESTLPVSAAPTPVKSPLTPQAELSRLEYLGISEQQNANILITTDDKDVVSISFGSRTEANLLTYSHLAYTGDGYEAERLQIADAQEENDLTIGVKGELDDQEIADIQALLKDLAQSLKQFLLGNTRAAEVHAPDAGGSLQSYSADFTLERRLTSIEALQAQAAQVSPAAQAEGQPLPEDGASTEAPAATAPVEPVQAVASPVEAPAQQMAERVHEHRMTPRKFGHLKKLLRALLKGMRSSGEIDDRQAATGREVLDSLFKRLAPQGGQGAAAEVSVTQASVRQEWVSLRYASSASTESAAPQVEETA